MTERKYTLHVQLSQTPGSEPSHYEILFIKAGQANGINFPEQVLRDSVAQWEGCSVFVDHSFRGRSVRDLGGVIDGIAFPTNTRA